jgi:D-serine dehydratase
MIREVGVGMNLTDPRMVPPFLALNERALMNNIEMMASYCRRSGVLLAPHGKTSMAPAVAARQLAHGAWGIAVADVGQAKVYKEAGCRRILIANQVTAESSLRWLSNTRSQDPTFEILCYVDSIAGIERTRNLFSSDFPIDVLIEVGMTGVRGGCRDLDDVQMVGMAAKAMPGVRLAGVAAFEGLTNDRGQVIELLDFLSSAARRLDETGCIAAHRIIVSAGGSIHFPLVVERLRNLTGSRPVDIILRSGSYVAHDHGFYEERSPWGARGGPDERLLPALELWAEVLSAPESHLAILGFGRRHAPEDHGLPVPLRLRMGDGREQSLLNKAHIAGLNDQHARLVFDDDAMVNVGETVVLGISHPCTAFDKWRTVLLVDDEYNIVDMVSTHFGEPSFA